MSARSYVNAFSDGGIHSRCWMVPDALCLWYEGSDLQAASGGGAVHR